MILFVSPFPILERVALVGGSVSSPLLTAAKSADSSPPMMRVLPLAGGAGVRAARAAKACGAATDVHVLGFAGGRLGKLLVERLDVEDLPNTLLPFEGGTRGSLLTLDREHGVVSDVPDSPARATETEQATFSERFADLLRDANATTVVLSLRNEAFPCAPVLQIARAANCRIIADVTGDALEEALQVGVSFLFASLTTLQRRTEESLQNDRAIVRHAATLLATSDGNENSGGVSVAICVTLGEEGALLVTRDSATRIRPPVVSRYKPTGSGEAVVGAFAATYAETNDLGESLALACAFAATSVAHDIPAESTTGEARIVRRETVVEPVLLR